MDGDVELLKRIYDRFNARDIDGVLTVLTDDVAWANGMDGGYVHGREAVREYWTRQWSMVSPHVERWAFRPRSRRQAAAGKFLKLILEKSWSFRPKRGAHLSRPRRAT